MKDKIRNLKNKRNVTTIVLVLLLVFLLGLISILNPNIKNIKINNILSKTTSLNASVLDGITEEITSNNYDEIKYKIKIDKEKTDQAVIVGTLSNKENKYARFKSSKEAEVSDNGKTIRINTTRSNVTVTVVIENAPYGTIINPNFNINSEDTNNSKINVDSVTITGKSVEGKVYDENGTFYKGLELSLNKNGEEVKRTYTKNDGEYVFSLGDLDTYQIEIEEDKYQIVRYVEETTNENKRILNIVVKEVEPFNVEINKTIKKLDLIINGKEEVINYDNVSKVVKSIKNAKTIEGSIYYNISIKNTGELKGTLTVLKDIIPNGLSFDENKNPGWVKDGNYLFYTVLEGKELNAFEKTNASLVLDIVKTDQAKNYINKAIATGEDYNYVAYYLNNSLFKEEYVISTEKISYIDPNIENFEGWYTDKECTNKYNFDNAVTKDIVLFGKIQNNKYNVTFIDRNPNNTSETILDIVEVSEGSSIDLIEAPEYDGYTFKCFELNDECYDDEEITGDIELYTKYTVNNYEITYDLDDGELESGKTNPTSYTVKQEITLNNPSKTGFTFKGWTGTGLNEPTINVTIPSGSTGKRDYTANFEINRSTLTINPNGGTYLDNASSVTFTQNYGTIKEIEESVRRGYKFKRYDKTGGGTYSNGIFTFNNDNATLTAVYEKEIYSISYNNITEEEREFLSNPIEYDVETNSFTLKNPNTRVDSDENDYQDFVGWNDGNSTSLHVTIEKGTIGNKTYTAVWRENENEYIIQYELDGGDYETGKTNPDRYTRQTETFSLNPPIKNGYTFTGWSGTNLTGDNNMTVTIPQGSAGDRSYTAHYQINNYDITYDGITPEEREFINNKTSYNVETNTFGLTNPNRTGYTFTGWSGTGISNKSTSVIIPKGSTGDRNYTANFNIIEYSLTYTLNDGVYESGKTNPSKYTITSDPIKLNNPSKPGYTFVGWSGTGLTGNNNTEVVIPTGSIDHRSFLANYNPITYRITYDYDGGNLPDNVTNPSTYNIETPDIVLNNPVKEGYTFLNYTIGNNIVSTISTGSMGDLVIKANYEIEHYNVTYYNESTQFAVVSVDWNDTTTKINTIPTKPHNIFLYWSEDGITEFDFENTHITTNKKLYAVYEEVEAPTIEISPSLDAETNKTWVCNNSQDENCGVTVTVSSEHNDYELYYKVGNGEATLYTGPFKVYENVEVSAWSKKSNINSTSTEENIVNVDSTAPTINQPATGAMSFNMSVSGTAQDADSGVKKFTLYVKEKGDLSFNEEFTYESEVFDGIKDHAENYDHTFYGVEENTEYIVKIVAEDYVGNVSELEVEVVTHPYVARVVGKNNMLWYTVDPDTKEFNLLNGKEFLMFDSIQAAVDYCANVECTIQTNPTLPVVNESVTIRANQNITIDLDGREIISSDTATFTNNGTLHIVDRNPRLDGNNNHDGIGKVINTTNKAIINNGSFILGDGSSEASTSFINPELDRPIIEGYQAAIEQNNLFYFFDGELLSDTMVLVDNGEDPITQYAFNIVITGDGEKHIGTLSIVDDPEARIKSTYYRKLKVNQGDNAFDSSRTGTFTTENAKMLSKIKQYGDYGFIYDAVNDEIYSGNSSTTNTTAISYLKIDLTNAEDNMTLVFDTFIDSCDSNSYGYISKSDSLSSTGTVIYKTTGNDVNGTKILGLEKGKVHYIYFAFVKGNNDNINIYETFKVSNFKMFDSRGNIAPNGIAMYQDNTRPTFVEQEDGSYKSNNAGQHNTTAHSYMVFDLRNETVPLSLLLDLSISAEENGDYGYVYINHDESFQEYNVENNRRLLLTGYSTKTYEVELEPGTINFVHFGYMKNSSWNGGNDSLTINSVGFSRSKANNILPNVTVENDPTYYFEKVDYDRTIWKDLSTSHNDATMVSSFYNKNTKEYNFSNITYGYIPNSDFNLTDYEETVYIEFSTDTLNGRTLYTGSTNEKITITTDGSWLIVSNSEATNRYSIYSLTNYNDGNKHSLMVTYKEGNFELYYDGEIVPDNPYPMSANVKNSNTYIGKRPDGYSNYYGKIYKVKVFNKELLPEEIDNTENLVLYLDSEDAVYPLETTSYISNNYHITNSTAHSYFTYDLTNINEDKYLYINTMIDSEPNGSYGYLGDTGYIYVSDSTSLSINDNNNALKISGTYDNQSTVVRLEKNKVNYVHFVYKKNDTAAWDTSVDEFIIKEMKLCNTLEDAYSVVPENYSYTNIYTFEKPVLNQTVDTIEILKDITLDATLIVPEEKAVILDLNGFTLTSNKNDYVIKNNGNLTIIDSDYEDRVQRNVDYKLEQARLFEEAKVKYFEDLAEYNKYAGLCEDCEVSEEYKVDHILEYTDYFNIDLDSNTTYYNYDENEQSQEYTVSTSGMYYVELWGASGGNGWTSAGGNGYCEGGKGAYTSGFINLDENDKLFVYVGEKGESGASGLGVKSASYNGGGTGGYGGRDDNAGSGGGATDIRYFTTTPSNEDLTVDSSKGLASRIMVAAGGGGGSCINNGNTTTSYRNGATLNNNSLTVAAWDRACTIPTINQMSGNAFGIGRNSSTGETTHASGGGGGGYYGGSYCDDWNFHSSGSGGTSYISGYKGSVAVISDSSTSPRLDSNENECTEITALTDATCSEHYSTKVFINSVMKSGGEEMPTFDGTDVMTGNSDNGYAKITFIISDERLQAIKESLPENYNVKSEPVFSDYLTDINIVEDINSLDTTDIPTYNDTVTEEVFGNITSTIDNVVLNEEYATLTINSGNININSNNKQAIVNRGKLVVGNKGIINANNNNTVGILNETKGDIVSFSGIVNVVGSNSIGVVNQSDDPYMSGIRIVTTTSNDIAFDNQTVSDVTLSNLDISGSGLGYHDNSSGNPTINDSNIKSTNNSSFYSYPQGRNGSITINNTNFNGEFVIYDSPRIVKVNNSSFTTVSNGRGILLIDNSTMNYVGNTGTTTINNSTITGTGTLITNLANGSPGGQNAASLTINDSIINSNASSNDIVVINNYDQMTLKDTEINNISNYKPTAIKNFYRGLDQDWNAWEGIMGYLNIYGETTIDSNFGTAINNDGTLTLGTTQKYNTEYAYAYSGKQEEFIAPTTGIYKLETWGASGGESFRYLCYMASCVGSVVGGKGGYASGTISLNEGDKLYIHVGGYGSSGTAYLYESDVKAYYSAYNGGGTVTGTGWPSGAGGGATDISLSNEDNVWSYDNGVLTSRRSVSSYEQRIVVAGGGSGGERTDYYKYGGYEIDPSTSQLGYSIQNGGGGYYGGYFGYGGSSYVSDTLSDRVLINGLSEMPDYYGTGKMQGNLGHGYAKITLLDNNNDRVTTQPTISATNYGITGYGNVVFYDGKISAAKAVSSSVNEVPLNYDIYLTNTNNNEEMSLVANADSRPVESGQEEFVAAIGNAKYTTIQNALNASNNGDEIDILVDINQQNNIDIPSDKIITIDYNGHSITTYSDDYLFNNSGTLTIKDSKNSKIKNMFYGDKYIKNTGTLNLNDIYIDSYNYTVNILENDGIANLNNVKFDFGNHSNTDKVAIKNNENGTLSIINSNLNLWYKNNMIDNYGGLTLKDNNIVSNNASHIVYNRENANVMFDHNSYSCLGGDNNYGRYILYNELGNATIKNTSTNVEGIYNSGVLTLESNNIPTGIYTTTGFINTYDTGIVIINSGTYNNTFNFEGTGRTIDNTSNLYSFIMHDGTFTSTLNRNSTGIFNIESGSINTEKDYAINNTKSGIINLGINNGIVDPKENTKPVITGKEYGIYTSEPSLLVNFYDGIITGKKSYNTTINNVETGYSIHRDYDETNNKEQKYLTSEPLFINSSNNATYNSIDELNYALSNGLINNDDEIKVIRDISILKTDNSVVIPSGLRIKFNLNNKKIDKNNDVLIVNNGELELIGGADSNLEEKLNETLAGLISGELELSTYEYSYSGKYEKFTAPSTGTYKIELWGAQGGNNNANFGKGAYTSGEISLNKGEELYIYVGGKGGSTAASVSQHIEGGYNGGGYTNGQSCCGRTYGSGGGATDVRYFTSTPSNQELTVDSSKGLASRIMVAAGGGGGFNGSEGGHAGGLVGINSYTNNGYGPGKGGTQTSGGINPVEEIANGSFGLGGEGGNVGLSTGGGGGYYGGSGSSHIAAAGGGSSYISGYQGAIAITSISDLTPKCADNSSDISCSEHFTGKVFTSPVMKAGNESMPDYNSNSNMTGNASNGYARITEVTAGNDKEYSVDDAYRYLVQSGEYNEPSENSVSRLDSTRGNIITNNGSLTISSGNYISEKSGEVSHLIINNENAELTITGGSFSKYFDKVIDYGNNLSSIINNSGRVAVTDGKFYTNGAYVETRNATRGVLSSVVFLNNSTGEITATGGTYDGYSNSKYYRQTYEEWVDTTYRCKGDLIYNYGTASISTISSEQSRIGRNEGTLTLNEIEMKNVKYMDNGGFPALYNTGDIDITDSLFKTSMTFIDNNGGNIDITNTSIIRVADGDGYRTDENLNEYWFKSSHVIRTKYNSSNDNEVNIINSNIYNKTSGEVIDNRAIVNIDKSKIEAYINVAITSTSSITTVKNESSIESRNVQGIFLNSNAILNIGEPFSTDLAVSQTNPVIKGKTYAINNVNGGTINYYDGILMGKTNVVNGIINNIEEGYARIDGTTGDYKTNHLDRVYVIQNITQASPSDEKKYYDLKSAFDAANNGDTLQMISNYNNLSTDLTTVNTKTIILDLNGKLLRQSNDVLIENRGTLTIIDNSNGKNGDMIGLTGSKMIDNYGTLKIFSGKLSTEYMSLLIKNNTTGTLIVQDEGRIESSAPSTLVDNDGTLNIYNGAYLHSTYIWPSGVNMIINNGLLNIIDLNNDNDENTSSNLDAPRVYYQGNTGNNTAHAIRVTSTGIINIFGGVFNNGQTYENDGSPDFSKLMYNSGTAIIKNLECYSGIIGDNDGNLTIEDSHFYNLGIGSLYSFNGSLTINDTVFEAVDVGVGDYNLQIGNAEFDNVDFYSRNNQIIGRTFMRVRGSTTIKNSSININTAYDLIRNDSTLDIINTPMISTNGGFDNKGTLTLDSSSLTTNGNGIFNNGATVTLKNNSTVTSINSTAITNHATLNLDKTTSVISQNNYGIYLDYNGIINLGEKDEQADTSTPYIEGITYGIYRNTQTSELNFYDGLVVGKSSPGPNAIYGGISDAEVGFETENIYVTNPNNPDDKTYKEYLVVSASSVAVAKVGNYSFASNNSVKPSKALQNAINFAIGDGSNVKTVELLEDVDLVDDETCIDASMPVTINLGGFTINQSSTYYLSPNITLNTNNLGANLSKLLGDVFDISSRPKDIIIYELSDGSILDTTKTYKLYKDGNVISLEKEELGKYRYKGNTENLTPIKGRLYLDNLYQGSYRLVSSDNKSIEFSIDNDGNISGNVTENIRNSNNMEAISNSEAELILTIQTGVKKHYYLLIIIPIILMISLLIILRKKKNKLA